LPPYDGEGGPPNFNGSGVRLLNRAPTDPERTNQDAIAPTIATPPATAKKDVGPIEP